jgi:acyl carrier protein
MKNNDGEIKVAILNRLREVAPEADLDSLGATENVRQTLDIDSYDFLQFLIGLSEDLGVEVPEGDYGKMTTLTSMVDYLSVRLK